MTGPQHFAPTAWQLLADLKPKETAMPDPTATNRHTGLAGNRHNIDYEAEALYCLERALDDAAYSPTTASRRLAEAQVWATLHLARISA